MKTYTGLKELTDNPRFHVQKKQWTMNLSGHMIDKPIIEIITRINKLSYAFTLQCCYGHFVYAGQKDPNNIDPLPRTDTMGTLEYRIAYIAFCIENNVSGRGFLKILKELTTIDPKNIQCCCAKWFWKKQVNSYALQVEPDRFKHEDSVMLNYQEAITVERVRNEFFLRLREVVKNI